MVTQPRTRSERVLIGILISLLILTAVAGIIDWYR